MKRKNWKRWHKWLALSFGWLFLLQGVTGGLLALEANIDGAIHPQLLKPGQPNTKVAFGQVYERVQQAYPDNRVIFIQRPSHGLGVYEIILDGVTGTRVYVDGLTGEITGERGAFTIPKNIFLILHTGVLGGEWLEGIYGLSGLMAIAMLIAGLVAWWPKRLRQGLSLSARSGWLFAFTSHRVLGALMVLVLFPVVLTGTLLSFHHFVGDLAHYVTKETPPIEKPVLPPQPLRLYSRTEIDQAVQNASQEVPGAEPNFIVLPRRKSEPISVRLRQPGAWHPTGKSQVWLDPLTLRTVAVIDEHQVSKTQTGLNHLYPLHTGHFGALNLAALLGLLSASILYMGITG
nr:PepSY domain-containing protein [Gammaproteobacteria bacterium]